MLMIDDIRLPEPKLNGLIITPEKIWSKNTGRTTIGEMVGDVICIKNKLKISWPPLSAEQVALIDAAITPAFFDVYYKDPRTNQYVTKPMYAGTPTYPVYSYASGLPEYVGVTVDLIEQ